MTDSAINLLTDLDGVSPDTYLQAEAYVQQLLLEAFPDRDFGVGRGMYWLQVVPAAALAAMQLANARLVSNSLNLGAIRQNPDQASDDLADLLLSNYYVTRRSGAVSTGTVTYVVNRATAYVIRSGSTLRVGSTEYLVSSSVFVYTSAAQVGQATDQLLQARSDGLFQFTVPVEAVETGSAGNQPRGTIFSPDAPPPGFVRAVAATDISGGSDTQTLPDLIAQIPEKFAASTWGSRSTIRGLILDLYPQADVGVSGFGDPEMLRDKHNPLGVASGGYTDIWVSTTDQLTEETRQLEAELVDLTARTWRIHLDRQQAAGIYEVTDIALQGGTELQILQVSRGYSTPNTPGSPLIFSATEGAFSAFQTLTIEFTDIAQDLTDLTVGQTRTYDVGIRRMDGISDLTTALQNNQALSPAVNALIRGVVPCRVSLTLQIRLLDADYESAINQQGMRSAIINRVSALGLGYGILSSSIVLDAIHDYLSGRSDVGATTVTLRGDIMAPTGERMVLGDSRELRIPDLPEKQVTRNTCKFFIDSQSIDIQFTRIDL